MEIWEINNVYYAIVYDFVVDLMSASYVTDVAVDYDKVINFYRVRGRGGYNKIYTSTRIYPNAMIMFLVDLTRVN
jgi:hypothetical protein